MKSAPMGIYNPIYVMIMPRSPGMRSQKSVRKANLTRSLRQVLEKTLVNEKLHLRVVSGNVTCLIKSLK